MPSSRGSSQPRDRTHISHIAGRALPSEPPGKPKCLSLLFFYLGMFWQFVLSRHSRVQLFAMPCTVDFQAPLSIGFSRQEYWSGLPCLPLEDLPDPRIKTTSLIFPALTDRFFTTRATKFSRSCNASKNLSQITVCNSENAWKDHNQYHSLVGSFIHSFSNYLNTCCVPSTMDDPEARGVCKMNTCFAEYGRERQ